MKLWAGGRGAWGPGPPLLTRRALQVHTDRGGLPPLEERPPDPSAPPAARPQDCHHPRVRVQREQPGHDPPPAPAQARPRHLPGEPPTPQGDGGPAGHSGMGSRHPATPQGGTAGPGVGVSGHCWTWGWGVSGWGGVLSCSPTLMQSPLSALCLAAPCGGPAPAGDPQPCCVPQLCPARGHLQLHRGHQLHRGQPVRLLRLWGGLLGECQAGGGPQGQYRAGEGSLQPWQPAQLREAILPPP